MSTCVQHTHTEALGQLKLLACCNALAKGMSSKALQGRCSQLSFVGTLRPFHAQLSLLGLRSVSCHPLCCLRLRSASCHPRQTAYATQRKAMPLRHTRGSPSHSLEALPQSVTATRLYFHQSQRLSLDWDAGPPVDWDAGPPVD